MIKKLGLKLSISKSNKLLKRREMLDLAQVKNIGVLVKDLNATRSALDFFKRECSAENIKLSIIAFNDSKEKISGHVIDFEVGLKDFGFTGSEKTESVKKIIKTPFDYLFCLNTSPILPFENILSKSDAKCRVGVGTDDVNSKLFDLVINPGENKDWLNVSKEMFRYIKMLKSK